MFADNDQIDSAKHSSPMSSSSQVSSQDTTTQLEAVPVEVDIDKEIKALEIGLSQEGTRAYIASYYTRFFLFIIGIVVLIPFLLNVVNPSSLKDPMETAKSLLTAVSSVLAGPFGFIVGFYFKQSSSNS